MCLLWNLWSVVPRDIRSELPCTWPRYDSCYAVYKEKGMCWKPSTVKAVISGTEQSGRLLTRTCLRGPFCFTIPSTSSSISNMMVKKVNQWCLVGYFVDYICSMQWKLWQKLNRKCDGDTWQVINWQIKWLCPSTSLPDKHTKIHIKYYILIFRKLQYPGTLWFWKCQLSQLLLYVFWCKTYIRSLKRISIHRILGF